jgi:uncharacterized protein with PCYCGC motif
MGRKSSSKIQNRQSGTTVDPPTPPPRRSWTPLMMVAALLAVAAAGTVYVRSIAAPDASPQAPAAMTPIEPPEVAQHAHPQENLPPLPYDPTPPARPMAVVQAAYKFAAEHPEVLSYVPCYCGCERSGHRGNEDCFVTRRDAKGDVVEWEPHGMT